MDHLGAKNAGLALDIARGADVELPADQVVQQRYEKAAASGLDEAAIATVTRGLPRRGDDRLEMR